jgi:hypothetical protein
MKIIKVTYTVQQEYAEQNKLNIQSVMSDLQKLNAPGINYHACLGADGKTFIHTAFFETDDDQKTLNELSSFKHFQEQLKASAPETPPKPEALTLVASSKNIF